MPKLRSGICSLLLTANKKTCQKSQNYLFVIANSKQKVDNVIAFEETKNKTCLFALDNSEQACNSFCLSNAVK